MFTISLESNCVEVLLCKNKIKTQNIVLFSNLNCETSIGCMWANQFSVVPAGKLKSLCEKQLCC
jgi:hypothetical protein